MLIGLDVLYLLLYLIYYVPSYLLAGGFIGYVLLGGSKMSDINKEDFIKDLDKLLDDIKYMMGSLENGYVNWIIKWVNQIKEKWENEE
jgi:hypothetical protein